MITDPADTSRGQQGSIAASDYERCQHLARHAARAAGARHGDVDDIVQDCLILAASNPQLLDPDRYNDSYLIRRFRWRAASWLRTDQARREHEAANPLRPVPLTGGYRPGENPETYVIRMWTREFALWLAGIGPMPGWGISPEARAALLALPSPDGLSRQILGRWMNGESQERIGELVGMSQQAVSKRIAKRIADVTGCLEDCLPDLLDELHELIAA